MKESVEKLLDAGFKHLHPVEVGGKKPLFKEWQQMEIVRKDIARLWANGENIGLITGKPNNVVAVDFDDIEIARKKYREGMRSTVMVRTPNGLHMYFAHPGEPVKNAVKVNGEYDIRGQNGYVIAPVSHVSGKPYKFVDGYGLDRIAEIPTFNMAWTKRDNHTSVSRKQITDVRHWLSRVTSVEGQNGSKDLCRAAQACVRAGLSQARAMEEMITWNDSGNAVPPWSLAEITRCVERVYDNNGL